MNPNSISPRSTSPSNTLRPINYSSQARQSISVTNGSKQYPYDNSNTASPTFSSKTPMTSTPMMKPNTNNLNMKISMIQQNKELSAEPLSGSLEERGRDRKKTTIFGTLKKRLSRSKTRNEETNVTNGTNGYTHNSVSPILGSPNRDTLSSLKTSTLKSNTGTMGKFGIPGSSRRSSISEMSGLSRLSSISNKTFLHEASSLVLEVHENGVKRLDLMEMNL